MLTMIKLESRLNGQWQAGISVDWNWTWIATAERKGEDSMLCMHYNSTTRFSCGARSQNYTPMLGYLCPCLYFMTTLIAPPAAEHLSATNPTMSMQHHPWSKQPKPA